MAGYYVGFDVHKLTVSYCAKRADGTLVAEGKVEAARRALVSLAQTFEPGWIGGLEATLFTGWIYDCLSPHAGALVVGHPLRLKAITASKKKSDRLDARTLADLLRCNLFPACHMASPDIRELRRVLRYRNLLVREATRMKNKTAGLLMEVGAQYAKKKLHGRKYFTRLLDGLEDTPPSVIELLKMTRVSLEVFTRAQRQLLDALAADPRLKARVERLISIPGVGEVLALTWALESSTPARFPSIGDAESYCGLCGALKESAGKTQRGPLSKRRNPHVQTMLIEAAKLAPRWNPQLAAVHARERAQGADPNQATLAVARKLVAYLLAVDKSAKPFKLREEAA